MLHMLKPQQTLPTLSFAGQRNDHQGSAHHSQSSRRPRARYKDATCYRKRDFSQA